MSQSNIIEFYFDFGSPTTYLAHKRLLAIKEKFDCEVIYKPVLLGGIFKATGNQSPAMIPAKGLYMNTDLQRYSKLYEAPLQFNPHFPINTITLMRAATALLDSNDFDRYVDVVFDAMWKEPLNLGDPTVLNNPLDEKGFDRAAIIAATADPQVKEQLKTTTELAVERGLFGAPTIFFRDEMYFGQDRLFFIEDALAS